MTGPAQVTTAPTVSNPYGIVSFRGVRRRCYFNPVFWQAGFYVTSNTHIVLVQEQRGQLIAIGRVSQ